jgi:hypothetical protein
MKQNSTCVAQWLIGRLIFKSGSPAITLCEVEFFPMETAYLRISALAVWRLITSSYLVGAYRAGFDKAARSPSRSAATP